MSDMLPRLVRADRLSTLFTPVASKVVLSVAVYVDRFGKLSVAPPSAYRLAPETVVVPAAVIDTPAPVTSSDPPVIARPSLIVELAATVSEPPVIDNGSLAAMERTELLPELIVIVGSLRR